MPIWETLGTAGSIGWNYVVKPGAIIIMSVPKEVEVLEEKRKKLRGLIREADRAAAAAAEEDDKRDQMVRARNLRIIDFRIEDVIDEWKSCLQHERVNGTIYIKAIDECMMCEACQHCDPGCVGLLCENAAKCVNTRCYGRLQIAHKIHNIKPDLGEINERSGGDGNESNSSPGQDQSSSIRNPDVAWKNLKRDPYRWQTKIEGFEAASKKMIDWLEDGRAECSVMIVVGMAGQGKTTLAKEIFDNKEAIGKFKCIAWINVSDFDDTKDFLRFMLEKFYPEPDQSPPYGYLTMGLESLKKEVKKYLSLHKKRYLLFFDDVWNKKFWQEIEHTVSINGNGNRIIITTRNKEVANTCEESSIVEVEVHEMQPLTDKQSMKLFCRTAFRLDIDNEVCPIRYANLSSEIVKRCEGLPLGIVAIGKHVSAHKKYAFNWKNKIEEAGITEILCLSYDNLPDHLKPCLLYFGIYPQDYVVKSKKLIWQWIAEGFANNETGKTFEEVAEDYLASLIDRNLVLVSSVTIDGKPRSCRVHYLVRDMILRKFEDLSFCRCINEDNRSGVSGITRHLSIATNSTEELHGLFDNLLVDWVESSFIRSLHFFTKQELPGPFVSKIPAKCTTLKVLDFENSPLSIVLENLGHLIYLKYLSFRNTEIQSLPKSIGKLRNLETLDVKETAVNELPEEVSKLRKLRHLLGKEMSLIQLKDGIGDMKSLQTLREVKIDDGDNGVGLIEKELGKLWQIRDLGLTNVGEEHKSAVCSAVNKMIHLEKLRIVAKSVIAIDLPDLRRPSKLKKLRLTGQLSRLPEWVPDHDRLAKLVLSGSKLTDDPLNSLKGIPNLSSLSIIDGAYEGPNLHFQGDFEELEELKLGSLNNLSSITVNSEALPSLKKLELRNIPLLMTVPSDMLLLKLVDLNISSMPTAFDRSISPDGVRKHQIINHVPNVRINGRLLLND